MSDFLAGIAPARHLAWDAGWGWGPSAGRSHFESAVCERSGLPAPR